MTVTGEAIENRRREQQMTAQTAAESIAASSGQTVGRLDISHWENDLQPPVWLTLDMIDWKHLPHRISESIRYNPIVRMDRADLPGKTPQLRIFRRNGDEQVITDPLQVIELWTMHRASATIVNATSKRHD